MIESLTYHFGEAANHLEYELDVHFFTSNAFRMK